MEESKKSKGLGDSIEKFTRKSGLKTIMGLAGYDEGKKDCGCNKRREMLNKAFPYKK
tara:strand:- start:4321 stop:4491 length:171 start_codon:yes stop_codon:yes gene_type:complete